MALSQEDVDDFIALRKELPPSRPMRWRERSELASLADMPVVEGGVVRGRLYLVVGADHERHWAFKLIRLGAEVLLWHADPPPQKHMNPPNAPAGWPRRFERREHEHLWHPEFDMRLARPVRELELAADHEAAFLAFCERANIESNDTYRAPPERGEQLRIQSP